MSTHNTLPADVGPHAGRSFCASDISEYDQVRFWNQVQSDPFRTCWNWIGAKDAAGYGRLKIGVRYVSAHRMSFALSGRPVPVGMCVCHHCDNRKCVNPDHLWLGNQRENNRDMMKKGRHIASSGKANGAYTKPEKRARGAMHGMVKLTEEMVRTIRAEYVPRKTPLRVFAERFNVSTSAIWFAMQGKITWRHVA